MTETLKSNGGISTQYSHRAYLPYSRLHKAHFTDSYKVNKEINFNAYGFHIYTYSMLSTVLLCSTVQRSGKVNGMEEGEYEVKLKTIIICQL